MGFDVGRYKNKREVVTEILERYEKAPVEVMSHATTKEGLWLAVRKFETDEKYIAFHLIERREKGEYAVKSMSEQCHPFYYTCPLKLLSMVPMANLEWRKEVRAYHQRRTHKYRQGEYCTVYEILYRVIAKSKGHYVIRNVKTEQVFKAMPDEMFPKETMPQDLGFEL